MGRPTTNDACSLSERYLFESGRKALGAGEAKMTSFYSDLNVITVGADEIAKFSPTGKSFRNINTPADLEEAERLLVFN